MTEVAGIDHIYVAVSDLDRAESFYDRVMLQVLGFRKNKFIIGGDQHVQYFNRHFGYVLRPARGHTKHDPYGPGLHHFCLRVESAADVVAVANKLRGLGIEVSEARLYTEYAPDYWATFFNDPDGVRLRSPTTVKSAVTDMTTGISHGANLAPQADAHAAALLCRCPRRARRWALR